MQFADLTSGLLFLYRGPRRYGIWTTTAIGQVLGIEPEHGVVHVRTFAESPEDESSLDVDIAHLPILYSAFERSVIELLQERDSPDDWWSSLHAWRNRRREGTAGAFKVPLWKAERMAWESANEEGNEDFRKTFFIEYAFPKPGPSGGMDTVEVLCAEK